MRVLFCWSSGTVDIELYDTPTARRLIEVVPFQASANTWGEEVYFDAPMEAVREPDAREVVERGEVCFWLQGQALALLFGPTPVPRGRSAGSSAKPMCSVKWLAIRRFSPRCAAGKRFA